MQSYEKYKKYKLKYLKMKKNILQYGGDKPVLQNINKINRFKTGTDMEICLNPIYGLYMCMNGFIPNNIYLYNMTQSTDSRTQKINNITRNIFGVIRPVNDIAKFSSRDIGRYIALLYVNRKFTDSIKYDNGKISISFISPLIIKATSQTLNEENQCIIKRAKNDINILTSYLKPLLKKYFPFQSSLKDNEDTIFDFHIILYCLWWALDNDSGIDEYYRGINDVFIICNKYVGDVNKLVILDKEEQNSFEEILYTIEQTDFHIYNFSNAKHFCKNNETYPDCAETTLRNFINLICYGDNRFSLDILTKYGAIETLKEYYAEYNSFNKQSITIYNNGLLNARDKWSELIIKNATNNVHLKKICSNINPKLEYKYEIVSGMSINGKETNFFQAIKNLFKSINNWDDFIDGKNITDIETKIDSTGIGTITITRYGNQQYKINCAQGHYYMELITPKHDIINFEHIENIMHREMISILLNKEITINNYLYIKWDSELISKTIDNNAIELILKQKLLELSYTNMFNLDERKKIIIDAESELFKFFSEHIVKKYNNNNFNNYTYKSTNFDFIYDIPFLKTTEHIIIDKSITNIDLTPLQNIEHISDNFLSEYIYIKEIDLSPLKNVKSIGSYFMSGCSNLSIVQTSSLLNLQSIGDSFMSKCVSLIELQLNELNNLESIGYGFVYDCTNLINIEMHGMLKLKSIGSGFMSGCSELINVNLSNATGLPSLKVIGNNFMIKCVNIERIELSELNNLETIGNYFMYGCINLEELKMLDLLKLTTISSMFVGSCKKLKNIMLSNLLKLTTISNNFARNCTNLETIDLSSAVKLDFDSIKTFAENCPKVKILKPKLE
jgi:hypothetical protein